MWLQPPSKSSSRRCCQVASSAPMIRGISYSNAALVYNCPPPQFALLVVPCLGQPRPSQINHRPFPPLAEFIHLISSEANEVCTKEGKKTIGPKHVIEALKVPLTLHHTAAHTISQPAPVRPLTWSRTCAGARLRGLHHGGERRV